jgi:hypothetical protein
MGATQLLYEALTQNPTKHKNLQSVLTHPYFDGPYEMHPSDEMQIDILKTYVFDIYLPDTLPVDVYNLLDSFFDDVEFGWLKDMVLEK